MKNIKILISAYGCEPDKGSEAGVGWNWVKIMALHYELWVITRKNNCECIQRGLPEDIEKNIHFIYYDLPDWIRKFKKKEKGLYWYYYLWHHAIMRVVREQMKTVHWDYTMHLTFGSIWLPTYLYKLGIPFIWGPVGGGESIPAYYLKSFSIKSRLVQSLRTKMVSLKEINCSLIKKCKNSTAIIARTFDTADALPDIAQKKVKIMLETYVSNEIMEKLQSDRIPMQGETVKIVYTGRLIPLKAVNLAIEAIAHSRYRERIEFIIAGRGPEREKLEGLAVKYNMSSQVFFAGEKSRDGVFDLLKEADLFLFPSLKEGGTWALMEAMAAGLPSICFDTSGMSIITDDKSAVRISPQPIEDTIREMTKAIDLLIEDPVYAASMGKNARNKIEKEFTWKAKEKFILELIDSLEKEKQRESLCQKEY